MKIMFLCLSLNNGGTERVVSNLVNYFVKENNVKLVKILKGKNDYEIDKNVDLFEIDKINYNKMRSFRKKIVKFSISRLIGINKIIKQEKPDVILCFLPLPSLYLMLLKRISKYVKNIPVILSERGDPSVVFKNKFVYKLMKYLYRKADGFVFQTNDAKKYYDGIINCRSEIIGNPINEKFIKNDYSHNRKKTIVTAGRLEKQKNHKLLIDGFKSILKEYPDYKLLIYGDGQLKYFLNDYINENNLRDNVILMGKKNNLYDELYDAGMFVLSSDFEGMPNALLEAMALGLPCISTDCPVGGPRMLIKDAENGLLVETNDVNQLSNKMKKIIENRKFSDKLSENALNSIKDYYPNIVNKKWEIFIKKIVNGE